MKLKELLEKSLARTEAENERHNRAMELMLEDEVAGRLKFEEERLQQVKDYNEKACAHMKLAIDLNTRQQTTLEEILCVLYELRGRLEH